MQAFEVHNQIISDYKEYLKSFNIIRDKRRRKGQFVKLAEERANALVEANGRFKELVGGRRYEVVYPILPPDILGVYVFIPQSKSIADL